MNEFVVSNDLNTYLISFLIPNSLWRSWIIQKTKIHQPATEKPIALWIGGPMFSKVLAVEGTILGDMEKIGIGMSLANQW